MNTLFLLDTHIIIWIPEYESVLCFMVRNLKIDHLNDNWRLLFLKGPEITVFRLHARV